MEYKPLHWFSLTQEEAARFNHPQPREIMEDEDGIDWELRLDDENWLAMGSVHRPKTRMGWFFHHLAHGLMMHYPPHKVVAWAFWYSFIEPFDYHNPTVVVLDEQ